jgi:hypothetical protein
MTTVADRAIDELVAKLCVLFNRELDDTIGNVYRRGLADVPSVLLEATFDRAAMTRRFMPTIAELREDAEACRQELAQRCPFTACVACRSRRPGWMVVVDPDGVRREARCGCWHRHQARLRAVGWTATPLFRPALPPGSEGGSD